MNARQKAKLYKKQRDYLYQALLNSVYENHKIGEEIEQSIIGHRAVVRFSQGAPVPAVEVIYEMLARELTGLDGFKQSVVLECETEESTGELVFTAHLQTIKPKLEEE